MKRWISFFLIVSLLLCGCGNKLSPVMSTESTQNDADLWIIMDFGDRYIRELVSSLAEDFSLEHEGITINLEALPMTTEERDARLEQLRVQIMSGNGPDLYLLYTDWSGDSLISDIRLAIENSLFLDISQYYDADTALEKERFQTQVMNAGVVDDARYVLPLRYDFPVAYVNVELLASAGLNAQDIGTGLNGMVEAAETLKSQTLVAEIGFFEENFLSLFTEAIDYERQTVTLDQEELEKFLTQYRSLTAEMGTDILYTTVAFGNYTSENEFWAKPGLQLVYDRDINMQWVEEPYAVEFSNLNDLVENLRIAKAEGIALAAIPMTAQDGSLTASVAYCGAVGANCDVPELAYEFLRQLLLEENQWHNNLSCYTDGWPVLTDDSWAELNADIFLREAKMGQYRDDEKNARRSALRNTEMVEDDFSVLNAQIDYVHFPFAGEAALMETIDSQLNPARNPDAMNVDVEELAEELIWELRWHLAEG